MQTDLVQTLTATFEGHAQKTENNVEFWLARDLQHLMAIANGIIFLTLLPRQKRPIKVLDIL